MKNILAAHSGSYPRIGDTREQQKLRNALNAIDRKEINAKALERIRNEVVHEVLAEQAKAGLDVVSDGHVRRSDSVSFVMRQLKGVSVAGLLRYFDTNTYFRQPQVTGALSANGSVVAEEIKLARAMSTRPVAASMLGPLSLSRLSLIKGGPYKNADALMEALVPLLAAEVGRLASAGADAVVIEEPCLLNEPKAVSRLSDALEVLAARKGGLNLYLFPSFGDAAPLYEKLQKLPVDGLVLDFTYSRDIADAVASSGSRMNLGLGLVDARNTRLESASQVARQAEKLLKRVRAEVAGLCPSNGLEYLPRVRAFEKLKVLARARDLVNGTGGGKKRRPKRKAARGKKRAAGKPKRSAAGGRSRRPAGRSRGGRRGGRR